VVNLNIETYPSSSLQDSEEIPALLLIADSVFAAIVIVLTRVATDKYSRQVLGLLFSLFIVPI
jgi:uncharacterized membrane protein